MNINICKNKWKEMLANIMKEKKCLWKINVGNNCKMNEKKCLQI